MRNGAMYIAREGRRGSGSRTGGALSQVTSRGRGGGTGPRNLHSPGMCALISSNSSAAIFAFDTCRTINISELTLTPQRQRGRGRARGRDETHAKVVVRHRALFQPAEPQVAWVRRSQEAFHALEQRHVEDHRVHGLLPHHCTKHEAQSER